MPEDVGGGLQRHIARILEKLARVREGGLESFGSSKHRFMLGPKLAHARLEAFEDAHEVALPADFRAFLMQAGASGAGPFYGLLPLEEWTSALRVDPANVPDWLSRPCVFTPNVARGVGRTVAEDESVSYASLVEHAADPMQGTIAIVDQGCTFYAVLIVSGRAAGRVLYVDVEGGMPYFVEDSNFLSWYERWLDELSWGHKAHWFGMDMPGDEAALASAALDASSPRKLDALRAMYRLPALCETTAAIVAARLHDSDAPSREVALRLVAKFSISDVAPDARRALSDPDRTVRVAALAALVRLGADWHDDARRCLDDPEPLVVKEALRALESAKAVSLNEALRLLDANDESVVAAVMRALQAMPSERAVAALLPRARAGSAPDALEALLSQVRAGAATSIQQEEALEIVLARAATMPRNVTAILRGLGSFVRTHRRALDALIDATLHPNAFIRFDAAAVLGDVAGDDAIEALTALTEDKTMPKENDRGTLWSVGENARRAIAMIRARSAEK